MWNSKIICRLNYTKESVNMELPECSGCSVDISQFIDVCSDITKTYNFLTDHGIMKREMLCPKCERPCRRNYQNPRPSFRCNRQNTTIKHKIKKVAKCRFRRHLFEGTWFHCSRIGVQICCKLIFLWLVFSDIKLDCLSREADIGLNTTIYWIKVCRKVCQSWRSKSCVKLGGNDNVVELIQRNLHSKVRSPDNWFICGYDRETGNCFVEYIDKRTKESVLATLQSWVLPGSTLMVDVSDSWEGLEEEGYNLLNSKHTRKYGTGNSVRMAERLWRELSSRLNAGRDSHWMPEYVAEFMFKWKYPNHLHRAHAFFIAMADTQPPCKKDLRYRNPTISTGLSLSS